MIDWNRVIELYHEVGPNEFGPVLELFLDEVEGIVMRLVSDDGNELARDLHFLKGSASNLGFDTFARLCDGCEAKVNRGETDGICLDEIVSCYSTTKHMFMRDLPRVTGPARDGQTGVA